ncbi:MAG TPA: sialidase family protein [Planctomycetota bacterium]|nr:sialidase family protein [Planctomycetota bacterium]
MKNIILLILALAVSALHAAGVNTLRVPEGGLQPQIATDTAGTVHLLYFKGEPNNGDLFYVKSTDGETFSAPLKVNSNAGSAVATGNIRGAHIALGKNGRVHVAWMGSGKAPKGPQNAMPMQYTRLNDTGNAFEPERNVLQFAYGLDGGGSIAADATGNVYVFWHADAGAKGEINRQVWIAKSTDDGKTFAREVPAFKQPTGACGCCGMRAYANAKGELFVIYRSASGAAKMPDMRDMFLLTSKDKGASFSGVNLHPWKVNMCVMSTASFSENAGGVLAAWETQSQVFFTKLSPAGQPGTPVAAPGAGKRKHPSLAVNKSGETLMVWTDGMGWQKGGAVEWQLFDASGKPSGDKGRADGVPPNSLVGAFAKADGSFVVVY